MAELQLIPHPASMDIPAGAQPIALRDGISIAISHQAEPGERLAAWLVQEALRRHGIAAPIEPRIACPDMRNTIVLAVDGRDDEVFTPGAHSTGFDPPSLVPGAHSTGFDPPSLVSGAHSTGFDPPSLVSGAHSTGFDPPGHMEARRHGGSTENIAGARSDEGSRVAGAAERYALWVDEHGIQIWGAGPAGVARGAQTLRQLLAGARGSVPALAIEDAPALVWRGIMLDVSRGKVPALETLKGLVDVLAFYKLNMLQLYVEHTFAFRRHPTIGAGTGALTPEEITALDAYCRERYIELVPCLQSFGHMRHMLELPEYEHLAESEQRWSLAPVLEESYALLDDLYADHLACFSSRYVNVCSDETYDLGKGRSKDVAEREGPGRLYLGHIKRLHALAAKYGRTMMVWDDIFLHYPELTSEIPGDAILLNWEYEAADDYPQVDGFHQAGLQQIVCPGAASWNTLFPRLANARGNIRNFIAAGLRVGALGVLTTDWGDGGHYNMLGTSWYPYAYSAAEAWTPRRLETDEFERRFGALTFGPEAAPALAAMRLLSEACVLPAVLRRNGSRTIDLFFGDPLAENTAVALPDAATLAQMDERERAVLLSRRAGCMQIPDGTLERVGALAREAGALLAPLVGVDAEAARTLEECRLAAREIAHAARKGQLARRVAQAGDAAAQFALRRELDALKHDLHALRFEHERLWRQRSKPEGIWRSLDRFDRSAALIDSWRARLASGYTW